MAYRPWINRKFGVEMESTMRRTNGRDLSSDELQSAIERGLTDAGVSLDRLSERGAEYYHSDSGATWDVKTDSSCGWEVASPILKLNEEAHNEELKAVCKRLSDLTPRIDRSCGLHVTVDVSDLTFRQVRNLVILWLRYEPFVFEMTPPSRRSNYYCPPLRKSQWANEEVADMRRVQRFLDARGEREATEQFEYFPRGSMNMTKWWRAKVVEFRLCAGTMNYEKVRRWAQFFLSLVARAKNETLPAIVAGGYVNKGVSAFYVCKVLGLAPSDRMPESEIAPESLELLEWMKSRVTMFARPNSVEA